MAKKKTPVTSVTPKSTVKPVSKAQQARTRKLIAGIASVTPVGRAANTISKARAGDKVSNKIAQKIGDKLSGRSSKKVQQKLHDIAWKDQKQTAKYNPDLNDYDAYLWSKHPAMVSSKGYKKAINQGKTVTDRQSVRYRKAEDKSIKRIEARALKAANKKKSK